jgi:hypothetical protein
MMRRADPLGLAAAAVVSTVLACAPLGQTGTDGTQPIGVDPAAAQTVSIQVDHNLPAALSMTIHLISDTSAPRRLGTVAPGMIGTFQPGNLPIAGEFRLVADVADGRSLTSPRFTLTERGVRWDLASNIVRPRLDP